MVSCNERLGAGRDKGCKGMPGKPLSQGNPSHRVPKAKLLLPAQLIQIKLRFQHRCICCHGLFAVFHWPVVRLAASAVQNPARRWGGVGRAAGRALGAARHRSSHLPVRCGKRAAVVACSLRCSQQLAG